MQDFTVLMAVYHGDEPALLERALSSIYENTLQPTAVILVVDGPVSNELNNVIEKYQKREFKLNVHRILKNAGLARALNEGLKHVKTEWVIRADADDKNLAHRFETQAAFMSGSFDLFGTAIQEISRNGMRLGVRKAPLDELSISKFAKYRNPFNHMTVAFRTSMAQKCGGYPEIHLKEDYALWASMIKNGARVMNIPEVLVEVTAGEDMYKRRGGWRYANAEIKLQNHLVSCGIKNFGEALLHGIARSSVFLMPSGLRGVIYEKLLRA